MPARKFGLIVAAVCGLISLAGPGARAQQSLDSALKNYRAQLFAYFKNQPQPMLPIFLPSGEQNGDVYRDVFGGYLAHREDCFNEMTPRQQPSFLNGALSTDEKTGAVAINTTISKIVDASIEGKLEAPKQFKISYEEVTSRTVSDFQLRQAFHKDDLNCAQVAQGMSGTAGTQVPMILGDLYTGRQKIELSASFQVTGNVKAEGLKVFRETLKKVGIDVKLGGEITGGTKQSQQVLAITETPFPIGWRPAFISLQHMNETLELQSKGLLSSLETNLSAGKDPKFVLSDFKEIVLPPDVLFERMEKGTPVAFDEKNGQHIGYIKDLGLLFAASLELLPTTRQ
jgi:hypothetical protein